MLLDLALKVDLQKLMYSFHEFLFLPTSTIVVEHFSQIVTITRAPKGAASKDTTERGIREVVELTPVNFLVYSNTQLYVEKESYLT